MGLLVTAWIVFLFCFISRALAGVKAYRLLERRAASSSQGIIGVRMGAQRKRLYVTSVEIACVVAKSKLPLPCR